jgi:hypothetical protein
LVLLAVGRADGGFAQAQKPCFAFILRGDVVVSCDGRSTQITHRGDIEGFGVSDERRALAYTTSRIVERTATTAWETDTTTLTDLKLATRKVFEGVNGALSTCGGLLPLVGPGGIRLPIRDLLSGDEVSFPPYVRFRCSSDRKTVVGSAKEPAVDLYEGVPPSKKIAGPESFNVYEFNISPDGSRVAYYGDLHPLCVFSPPGPAQCEEEKGGLADVPSVNDSGEVLVAAATPQGCFYKTMYNFSPEPFPGAKGENRDACLGVGYWRPGLKSIEIIEPLGRAPQWITPATAELLRAWSARTGGK